MNLGWKRRAAPAAEITALRELLHRRTTAACEQAAGTGEVSLQHIEALERLERLLAITDAARRPAMRRRWPLAAFLAVTLLIVSVLLFARTSETEIDADLDLSQVSFSLSRAQVLANAMGLSTLGVSGLREVEIPRARGRPAQVLSATGGTDLGVRLSASADPQRPGTVTLAAVALPAKTQVVLRPTEIPRQYRLSLRGPDLLLSADVSGVVSVGASGAPAEVRDFGAPKLVVLKPGSTGVDLDLTFPQGSKVTFPSQLWIENLSLVRIEQFAYGDGTLVWPLSTIRAGVLYFESLNGKEHRLRPGERLQFGSAEGQVRLLQPRDDGMGLRFHGRVGNMTSGAAGSRRSLMPSYLEWLQARHGLSLLWGTTLYLFGLSMAVLNWWRPPK